MHWQERQQAKAERGRLRACRPGLLFLGRTPSQINDCLSKLLEPVLSCHVFAGEIQDVNTRAVDNLAVPDRKGGAVPGELSSRGLIALREEEDDLLALDDIGQTMRVHRRVE